MAATPCCVSFVLAVPVFLRSPPNDLRGAAKQWLLGCQVGQPPPSLLVSYWTLAYAGFLRLDFGASAGPRARKSRSRPRDVRAGKFCPQFARKAIEFLRRSGRRQYRYLMDNLDPVEATEIFLVDAAAAANEPDHKNEIL